MTGAQESPILGDFGVILGPGCSSPSCVILWEQLRFGDQGQGGENRWATSLGTILGTGSCPAPPAVPCQRVGRG